MPCAPSGRNRDKDRLIGRLGLRLAMYKLFYINIKTLRKQNLVLTQPEFN
jgi:hypothetical protein